MTDNIITCSVCGIQIEDSGRSDCPNCGAAIKSGAVVSMRKQQHISNVIKRWGVASIPVGGALTLTGLALTSDSQTSLAAIIFLILGVILIAGGIVSVVLAGKIRNKIAQKKNALTKYFNTGWYKIRCFNCRSDVLYNSGQIHRNMGLSKVVAGRGYIGFEGEVRCNSCGTFLPHFPYNAVPAPSAEDISTGQAQESYCKACGNLVKPGVNFCDRCGSSMK